MDRIQTLYLCIVIFTCVLGGCGSDTDIQSDDLVGNWEVISAERDGKRTETVVGATFQFGSDGNLTTNIINGRIMSGPFTTDETSVVHDLGSGGQMVYKVSWMEQGGLELRTKIQGYNFRLILNETPEE